MGTKLLLLLFLLIFVSSTHAGGGGGDSGGGGGGGDSGGGGGGSGGGGKTGKEAKGFVGHEPSDQHLLYNDLFRKYNKHLMPIINHDDILKVHFEIALFNVLSLDSKKGIMVTNTEVILIWKDPYLSWDPAMYNHTTVLRVQYSDVWHPDIVLHNTADTSYETSQIHTNVIVDYDGTCKLLIHSIFTSVCDVDVQWFPFDQQTCDMIFTSWTNDNKHMVLEMGPSDITRFHPNQEFFLENFYSENKEQFDPCCEDPFSVVSYHIQLQRRVKFALFFFIMPGVLINICALLVFSLPAETGEKIGLGINSMLAMIVFLMAMTENLPPTQRLPLAGVYYGVCLVVLTFNIVFSVYVLNLTYTGDRGHRVPVWLRSTSLWGAWLVWITVPQAIISDWQVKEERDLGKDKVFPFEDDTDDTSGGVKILKVKTVDHHYDLPPPFKDPFHQRSVEALEGIYRIMATQEAERETGVKMSRLSEQWKFISRVLDRMLFILFGVLTFLFNIIILTQSPYGEMFEYCPYGHGMCEEEFDYSEVGGLDHF